MRSVPGSRPTSRRTASPAARASTDRPVAAGRTMSSRTALSRTERVTAWWIENPPQPSSPARGHPAARRLQCRTGRSRTPGCGSSRRRRWRGPPVTPSRHRRRRAAGGAAAVRFRFQGLASVRNQRLGDRLQAELGRVGLARSPARPGGRRRRGRCRRRRRGFLKRREPARWARPHQHADVLDQERHAPQRPAGKPSIASPRLAGAASMTVQVRIDRIGPDRAASSTSPALTSLPAINPARPTAS